MRYVLTCALLAACGGRKVPEAAPPDAAPVVKAPPRDAAPPNPALDVTPDGQPVEIKSILANRGNGGDVEVTFANYEYTCEQLIEGFRPTSSESDVTFSVRLVRRLLVDGTFVWAHKGSYFDGTSSETMNGPGPALAGNPVVDGSAGATTRFELDLALE